MSQYIYLTIYVGGLSMRLVDIIYNLPGVSNSYNFIMTNNQPIVKYAIL